MWWDYPCRWFTECFRRAALFDAKWTSRRGLLGLLVGSFSVLHRRLEILYAFAQTLAQIGQLAGTKDQQRDSEDDENLRQTQFTNHVVNLHAGFARRSDRRILGQRNTLR